MSTPLPSASVSVSSALARLGKLMLYVSVPTLVIFVNSTKRVAAANIYTVHGAACAAPRIHKQTTDNYKGPLYSFVHGFFLSEKQ